jgi:hypothetical protein
MNAIKCTHYTPVLEKGAHQEDQNPTRINYRDFYNNIKWAVCIQLQNTLSRNHCYLKLSNWSLILDLRNEACFQVISNKKEHNRYIHIFLTILKTELPPL